MKSLLKLPWIPIHICSAFTALGALTFGDVASAATINAADYGAAPNDAGDATAAIQTALNVAAPGDEVLLPAGVYRISDQLTPVNNTALRGAGIGATTILYTGAVKHPIIALTKTKSIEFEQLTLDGGGPAGMAAGGIRAENCSGLYVHDLAIQNIGSAGGNGIELAHDVTDSRFENCAFSNIGVSNHWASAFRISWRSSRNTIIGNRIANTGRGGILCNDGCNDLIIQRNVITGSGSEHLGIELWGGVSCDRAIVEDNMVDHWLSISGSNYAAVRRNTITAADGVIAAIGIECVATHDSIFTDNVFGGGASNGISLSAGPEEYDFFAYNNISNATDWGIQVQGDGGGANRLYFYKDSYQSTQRGPKAPLDTGYGFRIHGNTHFLTLDSVTIANNPSWAIQGIGVGSNVNALSVVNCIITNNRSAFSWAGHMADLQWENNTVSGNTNNSAPESTGFADQPPTAVIDGPATIVAGQPVNLTSASTDPDGKIAHTLWDLNSGAPVAAPTAACTYAKPGHYRVSLLVWDDAGRAAHAEKTIAVLESGGAAP